MNESRPTRHPHSVELNIEELVLHGFPARDRYQIARAIQRELARLFSEQGVPASLKTASSTDRLDVGDVQVARIVQAETMGAQVARSVYRGMSQ